MADGGERELEVDPARYIGAVASRIAKSLVDEAFGQDPHLLPRASMPFYPAALPLPAQTLRYVTETVAPLAARTPRSCATR
jgi:hypothetical protein